MTWKYVDLPINAWENAANLPIGENWQTGTHTFPEVWVFFYNQIPDLAYFINQGKFIGLPINIP